MLWGSADVWYESKTKSDAADANDTLRGEIYPIGVQYKGVRLGWFVDYTKTLGTLKADSMEESFEHQLRFYAPLYKGERLTVQTEIRHTLHNSKEYKEKTRLQSL